jgi:prolipoprotein diacylglyceryltransferase
VFEAAAWLFAIVVGWRVKWRFLPDRDLPMPMRRYPTYMLAIWLGAVAGAIGFGTFNLILAGLAGTGRSIIGATLGGIIVAETFKAARGIHGSTGVVFVMPLAVAIAIGRIGCFFGGLADYTYGVATRMPWGVDFGDGIVRHPVQLYEAAGMAVFALVFWRMLHGQRGFCLRYGFYLFVIVYAGQRFLVEWLKPYPALLGPFNLFQVMCLLLIAYGAAMSFRVRRIHAPA